MDQETISQILAVDIPADKKLEILAILNTRPGRSKAAERMARYRAKRHACVTGDVTRDVTVVTPPSPPPLSPTPPIPAPTPEHAQERAHTREGGELFPETAKPEPAHKRIKWNPDNGWQGITAKDREAFSAAAPAVDIDRATSSADLWLRANPDKAKRNYYRFLVNWLARSQERGGDKASNPTNGNSLNSRSARPPVTRNVEPLDPNRPRLNETAVRSAAPGVEESGCGVYDDGEGGSIFRV